MQKGQSMKKSNTIPGIVSTAFGLFVLVLILTGKNMALLGTKETGYTPGQGFFPLICATLLVVFGAVLTIRGLISSKKAEVDETGVTPETKENIRNLLLVGGGLIVVLAAWKISNQFLACVFCYSVFLNRVFKRSWLFTAIFSLCIVGLIYFMFVRGFSTTFKV